MSKVFEHSDNFQPKNILEAVKPATLFEKSIVKPEDNKVKDPPPPQVDVEKKTIEPSESPPTPAKEDPLHDEQEASIQHDLATPSPQNHAPSASPLPELPPEPPQEPESVDIDGIAEEFYNKGMQDCLQNLEDDLGSSIKAVVTISEEMNQIRETILNNSMVEMQNLVFAIAEKIIRQSVNEQDETIQKTVEEAIRSAVKSDEFVIQVNPDDFEIIQSKSPDLINSLSGLENLVVKADPRIERGGCKVESSNCTVDATIDIQLEIIKDKIRDNI